MAEAGRGALGDPRHAERAGAKSTCVRARRSGLPIQQQHLQTVRATSLKLAAEENPDELPASATNNRPPRCPAVGGAAPVSRTTDAVG